MRFQSILFTILSVAFAGSSLALPVDSAALQKRAFTLKTYPEFQISSTPAGDAQAKAAAVFVTPFDGVDLATVSQQDRDNVEAMRRLAEQAETDQFNPAIKAASGAAAKALQNGKIQNKVLKLTGIVQVGKIDLAKAKAAGKDTSSIEAKIAAEQKKLTKNIATDVAAAGQDSKGVV